MVLAAHTGRRLRRARSGRGDADLRRISPHRRTSQGRRSSVDGDARMCGTSSVSTPASCRPAVVAAE